MGSRYRDGHLEISLVPDMSSARRARRNFSYISLIFSKAAHAFMISRFVLRTNAQSFSYMNAEEPISRQSWHRGCGSEEVTACATIWTAHNSSAFRPAGKIESLFKNTPFGEFAYTTPLCLFISWPLFLSSTLSRFLDGYLPSQSPSQKETRVVYEIDKQSRDVYLPCDRKIFGVLCCVTRKVIVLVYRQSSILKTHYSCDHSLRHGH